MRLKVNSAQCGTQTNVAQFNVNLTCFEGLMICRKVMFALKSRVILIIKFKQ